ncbi:hypothetical protein BZA05DRAFT_220265 [Tricharina praecox]|uniref:uncharacterized protein n=1 Tax=Tricharina praecox TaxID=43433 RepID=UPI00221EEA49|nr:uncharacterized protein BZA05DRAFT_220265 [Tricharina praecox]KAI5855889.1 hypothetical protein BZA05DRAFT_220265 [Tricharina praecox]
MAGPGPTAPDDWHWLELPAQKPRRIEGVAYDLYMLATLHLVRCTYRMFSTAPEVFARPALPALPRTPNALVRVYVLPVDVAQDLVSRRNRNVRKYMRSMLEEVDVAAEMWEGEGEGEGEGEVVRAAWRGEKTPLLTKVKELPPMPGLHPRLTIMEAPTGEVYYLDLKTCELFEQPVYEGDSHAGKVKEAEEKEEMDTAKTQPAAPLVEGLGAAQRSKPADTPAVGTKRRATPVGDDVEMVDLPKRAKTVESG